MKTLNETIVQNKKGNFSVFFTAGYPKLTSTSEVLSALNESNVDFIEIGIPFSDPLADGPIIQHSSTIALENGMTLALLFEQLADLKNKIEKPYLLMGYLNSLLAFGIENFYKSCANTNVKNIIIPDLPIDEFKQEHELFAIKYNVSPIFLISSETETSRIREIDKISNSFIYLLSGNTTTGNAKKMQTQQLKKIKALKLRNPLIIGFGIKSQEDYEEACKVANGAIIGSAFITMLEKSKSIKKDVLTFINTIKKH